VRAAVPVLVYVQWCAGSATVVAEGVALADLLGEAVGCFLGVPPGRNTASKEAMSAALALLAPPGHPDLLLATVLFPGYPALAFVLSRHRSSPP
jgi:hypothetical protein